jgi:hypothetical protein
MMCEPEERDLAHAARRALAEAETAGLAGEALVEAATDAVAALWAHVDRAVLRAAVEAQARRQNPVLR